MKEAEAGLLQPTTADARGSSAVGEFHAPASTLANGQTGLYPQFLLFGDSITQRACLTVQPRLQDLYVRQADIVNRGFSGYTSTLALLTLPHILPLTIASPLPYQTSVRLITIFFGANDACLPGNPQHVSLSDYTANLRRMIEHCFHVDNRIRVILVTPPPVNEWQLMRPLTRTAINTKRYACAARQLAAEMQVPCLDLWTTFISLLDDVPNRSVNDEHLIYHEPNSRQPQSHAIDFDMDFAATENNTSSKAASSLPPSSHFPTDPVPGSLALPSNDTLSSLFLDGLHLTSSAYDVLFTELITLIRSEVPECAPENVPWCFRNFRDMLDMSAPPPPPPPLTDTNGDVNGDAKPGPSAPTDLANCSCGTSETLRYDVKDGNQKAERKGEQETVSVMAFEEQAADAEIPSESPRCESTVGTPHEDQEQIRTDVDHEEIIPVATVNGWCHQTIC